MRGSYPEEQGPSEDVEAELMLVPASPEQRRKRPEMDDVIPENSNEGDVIRVDFYIPSDSPFYCTDRDYPLWISGGE